MVLAEGGSTLPGYLSLGIEHLLFGFDHILFVVLLVVLIRAPWPLVRTVTAFTAAHTITLGLSALSLVVLPQRPVEVLIALSILLLASELTWPVHSYLIVYRPDQHPIEIVRVVSGFRDLLALFGGD